MPARAPRLTLESLEAREVPGGTPTVTAGTMMNATEGGGWGWFFLYRTGDTSGALTVSYTVGGTATAGADYTPLSGTATFAPDNSFAGVFVDAPADGIAEPDETVVLDVQAGAGYAVGGPSSATLTITDNTLVVTKVADATEGGANGVVRFTRHSALFSTQTVNYAVSGTATPTADYGPLSGSVTFDIGVWSVDVAVAALADDVSDDAETVTVTVAPGFGYAPGVDNSATVIIREPSGSITAVRPDGSGAEEGWVAENNDNDNYNFYGDPATSLDQIEDKNELGQVAGEDDLIPIHLSPIAGAVSGDSTWLNFASFNIRLWMSADKSGGQIASGMTEFDATQAHTVYAEGLGLSPAVNAEVVNLEWSSGANPRRIIDQLPLTVFQVSGPQNVPGYSRHTYTATLPGQVAATFGAITGGTQHAVTPAVPGAGGATTNSLVVNWGEGEVVGTFQANAPGGFFATRRVNVVKVQLDIAGADNKIEWDSTLAAQRADKRGVHSSPNYDVAGIPAMYASLKVARVAGPLVDGARRGQRFIDIGFMQTVTHSLKRGDYYPDFADPFSMISNTEKKSYIDSVALGDKPWYEIEYDAATKGQRRHAGFADNAKDNLIFDMNDSPDWVAVPAMVQEGTMVSRFHLKAEFVTYFAVHTRDQVASANSVYTIRAYLPWTWNASGAVDGGPMDPIGLPDRPKPTGKWTPDPSIVMYSTPFVGKKFAEVTSGESIPMTLTTGKTSNEVQQNETWRRSPESVGPPLPPPTIPGIP